MKEKIYTLAELSDSREVFEAKTPPFMSLFIYTLLLLCLAMFVWMWCSEIEEQVKITGIVRPHIPVSVVRNVVGGTVTSVHLRDEMDVRKGELLYSLDSAPLEKEIANAELQLERLMDRRDNLTVFEQSLQKQRNLFPPTNGEYYHKYLVYEYELEKLQLHYEKAQSLYEIQRQLPAQVAKVKLDELGREAKLADLNRKKYISEATLGIQAEQNQVELEILRLAEQLEKLRENQAYCQVRAPIDGKIQLLYSFNPHDYLPPDIEIVRIIPGDEKFLKVELLIPNKDISRIETGKTIQYSFHSLPKNEYGQLYGKVSNIQADIAVRENLREPMYRAEGSLDKTTLTGSRQETVQIKIGMVCEARIILEKKKLLLYILENLNFSS